MKKMKKLWFPLLVISIIISAFCVFYVAVGAGAVDERSSIPEGVFNTDEKQDELMHRESVLLGEPCEAVSLNGGVTRSLLARGYDDDRIYEMNYTVKGAYLSDSLPKGAKAERLREAECHNMGVLREGYTFLCIDVIIDNNDEKKQMYIVNSASVGGYSLLGFCGQQFENTAILHAELYPDEPFETTLIFAVRNDINEVYELYINNLGYGSPNGNCVYIDLEMKK